MIIITGATGQIGSGVVKALNKKNVQVKGVVRNPVKAESLNGVEIAVASLFDVEGLKEAFAGGQTAFLLTPEDPGSEDTLSDANTIISNYREAVTFSGVEKIVGLSSLGAQHDSGTGNLLASYNLEHAFSDIAASRVFIRPAYYYSNWLPYLEPVQEHGILPTFFPVNLKIPMVAPGDVAEFAAKILTGDENDEMVYEIAGPELYSSADVANVFGSVFNKEVEARQIPPEEWKDTLRQAGFTTDAANNLAQMTQAVIDGKAMSEKEAIKLNTTFYDYLKRAIK